MLFDSFETDFVHNSIKSNFADTLYVKTPFVNSYLPTTANAFSTTFSTVKP